MHICVCSSPKPCWIVISISLQTPVVPVRRCLVNDSFLDFLFQNNHLKLFFPDASLVFRHEPYLIFGLPFSLRTILWVGKCNAYWISCDCISLQIFVFNYDGRCRGRCNFSPFGHSLRLDSLLLITTHCLQFLSQFSINTNLQTAHMKASLNYFFKRAFLRCPAKLSACRTPLRIGHLSWGCIWRSEPSPRGCDKNPTTRQCCARVGGSLQHPAAGTAAHAPTAAKGSRKEGTTCFPVCSEFWTAQWQPQLFSTFCHKIPNPKPNAFAQ